MEDKQTQLKETIGKVAGFMNLDCQVEFREQKETVLTASITNGQEKNVLFVSIYTPEDAKFLIGRDGQNITALEHILRLMFIKSTDNFNLILDVNDYRKSKTTYLIDVAKQAVTRVRNTQKAEALVPMTPYERRVVHMELATCPDLVTESIGEEPYRRVVIKPYP